MSGCSTDEIKQEMIGSLLERQKLDVFALSETMMKEQRESDREGIWCA